jgi:hypothetical protein
VGRADGHHTAHALITLAGPQPGPDRQAAHAVAYQQGRHAGGSLQALYRGFNDPGVLVDGAKHRFQVDRHNRQAATPEIAHPGVPQTPVAHKTMDQHNTGLPACTLGHKVSLGP